MSEGGSRFQFRILPEGTWRDVAPGVRRKDVAEDVYLLRMAPGTSETEVVADRVTHRFVIEGDLNLGYRHLRAGDNDRAAVGLGGTPPASDGGCLVLIVLSAT
jgi:hypothetical protein